MAPLAAWAAANAGTIMAASAAVTAVGAVSAAQAQRQSFESQQQAAVYNATIQKQNADAAMAAASANELSQRRDNDVKLSFERGRMIESGGGLVGTNVGALDQSATNLELAALNTRYRGAVTAVGDMQQSTLDQYSASVAKSNASSANTAGYIGALGGALGSAANYSNSRALFGGGGTFATDNSYGIF
jgi:hypothetical protein